MKFNDYVGKKRGGSPGSTEAIKIYKNARENLISQVKNNKNYKKNDLTSLEAILNKYYFGKDDKGNYKYTELSEKFLEELTKKYNEYAGDVLDKSTRLTDASYALSKNAFNLNQKKENIEQIIKKHQNSTDITLRVFDRELMAAKKEYEEIMNYINSKELNGIELTKKEEQFVKILSEARKSFKKINRLYNIEKNLIPINNSNKILKNFNVALSSERASKGATLLDSYEMSELRKEIGNFRVFSDLLKRTKMAPAEIIGELGELSLAYIQDDINRECKKVKAKTAEELMKTINGKKLVSRISSEGTSNILSFNMETKSSMKHIADVSLTENKQTTLSIGGIKFSYTGNGYEKAFKDKQAKADIIFNVPTIDNGRPSFNISMKNWQKANTSRDFGETSIFSALSRTLNNSDYLSTFAFVLQDPETTSKGVIALALVHDFIRISLFADILLGVSQGKNMANTLVILDRIRKKVKVYDLEDELLKIIDNEKGQSFKLDHDIDFSEMDTLAQYTRNRVFKTSYHSRGNGINNRNKIYESIIYSYLHSKKFKVLLNNG